MHRSKFFRHANRVANLLMLTITCVFLALVAVSILVPESGLGEFLATTGGMAMALRTRLLPTPAALPASTTAGTATFDIPIGQRVHVITLIAGYDGANAGKETVPGAAADQLIGDIKLKLNGKVQRLFTAKQLASLNLSQDSRFPVRTSGTMGSSGYREYFPIFLAEPYRKDTRDTNAGAWNLHPEDVGSCQLEVDLKALTSPFLGGYYEADALTGRLGSIVKVLRQTLPVNGTSVDIAGTVLGMRDGLQSIHAFATSDGKYVNKVKLTADGIELQEELDYLMQRAKLFNRLMNPDTNAYAADPTYLSPRFDLPLDFDDPIGNFVRLNALRELTLKLYFDSAASGTIDLALFKVGAPE